MVPELQRKSTLLILPDKVQVCSYFLCGFANVVQEVLDSARSW